MATTLLDGTDGNIDMTLNAISYKAVIGLWAGRIVREFFEQTVFASGGWRARVPGLKQMVGSMAGFMSKGFAGSDPLALFANQTPYAGVFTATTGCTLSGNFHQGSDDMSLAAAGNSGRVMNYESYDAVTSTWVVV